MTDNLYLTAEGAEKLKEELSHLVKFERVELAKRLRSAVQQGDLSENADYHKAKEDQAFLEGRIQELEYLLKNALIIENTRGAHDVVEIGAHVTIQEEDFPEETFLIVGAKEADPRKGRISNESPIGHSLLGGRMGDAVIAQTPGGEVKLKILRVE